MWAQADSHVSCFTCNSADSAKCLYEVGSDRARAGLPLLWLCQPTGRNRITRPSRRRSIDPTSCISPGSFGAADNNVQCTSARSSNGKGASSTVDAMSHVTNETWNAQGEPIAWRPTAEYLARSRLLRFMTRNGLTDYAELCARAAADPAWFWGEVATDLDLRWHRPYTRVMDASAGPEWTRWFIDGQFNYVANALDKHLGLMGSSTMAPQ